MVPSVQEMEAYIRAKAAALGIDPEIAVRVARSEGLQPGTWQGRAQLAYGRERSYGPYQLHVDPRPGHGGMGNDMIAQTGVDPSDPRNWRAGVDFALGRAQHGGWSPWYGAKHIGVTGKMGIGGAPSAPSVPAQGTAMGGFAAGPGAVAARNPGSPPAAPAAAPAMVWDVPPPQGPMSNIADALAGMVGGGGTPMAQGPDPLSQQQTPVDFAAMSKQLADQSLPMRQAPKSGYGAPGLPSLAELLGSM